MMNQSTQGLASLGRNGDTMLMHVNPDELRGLQGLAMSQGGSLSINPHTGLPEAFSLKGFFKSLLPTIVGGAASMIPGMQFASYPMLTGILAGAATGALTNKNKLLGAVTGGLGGYSGASIMGAGKAAAGAMPGTAEAANAAAANAPYQGGWVNPETATGAGFGGAATTGADLAQNNAIITNAQQSGLVNSAMSGASAGTPVEKLLAQGQPIGMANVSNAAGNIRPDPTFLGNVGNAFKGIGGAATGNQAAIDAYTKSIGAESALGALGKTALPFGGAAVMGGLEPSDFYGNPVQTASAEEKYDPYSRLDLTKDTGLRLVAKGGYIDGYAEGGTIATGGIRDLYGSSDNQNQAPLSRDGYGLGRLNQLGNQQSLSQAQTLGYAEGGVAELSLVDKPDTTPDQNQAVVPEQAVLSEAAKTQAYEKEMNKLGITGLGVGNIPTNNFAPGSLATIANAMKNQNVPPEAAFVQNLTGARTGYAMGGLTALKPGGYLSGGGDGMSDSIPATIEGKQQARLADGEFVIPADVVSHIGNGSSKAGSKRLYSMLDKIRKARTGHTKQGKQINPNKYMPA